MKTAPKTYSMTTDHPASSYGQPVLLDDSGNPHGPADVGLWDSIAPTMCGRVDLYETAPAVSPGLGIAYACTAKHLGVHWSGYGPQPDRMWRAVCSAFAAGARHLRIYDAGKAEAWA